MVQRLQTANAISDVLCIMHRNYLGQSITLTSVRHRGKCCASTCTQEPQQEMLLNVTHVLRAKTSVAWSRAWRSRRNSSKRIPTSNQQRDERETVSHAYNQIKLPHTNGKRTTALTVSSQICSYLGFTCSLCCRDILSGS